MTKSCRRFKGFTLVGTSGIFALRFHEERECTMKNYLVAGAFVASACHTLVAQVTPSYSSITSEASISLTGDNGSDVDEVIDDQGAMLGPLTADAVAGFSNANGVFDGSVSGSASFIDASSGSFFASSSFMGSDSGLPGAMGSFGHTLSSEFEYQFFIDGDGTLEIDGVLTNSSTVFESFILLRLEAPSGSYRLRVLISSSGSGQSAFLSAYGSGCP